MLARISGLFSGRGYNIEALTVAPTLDPTVSRMTIITRGENAIIEQITKQLNKLIDVIKVIDYTGDDHDHVEREIVLVKVTQSRQTALKFCACQKFSGARSSMSPRRHIRSKLPAQRKDNRFYGNDPPVRDSGDSQKRQSSDITGKENSRLTFHTAGGRSI